MSDKGNELAQAIKTSSAAEPGLDKLSQSRIGDQLRAMYEDLVQQPVPDRFKDLLAQLDKPPSRESGDQS